MAKKDRICVCCGAGYKYCSQCDSDEPLWKYTFDKIECVQTFNILTSYGVNQITKEEARQKLEKINMRPENVLNPTSRKQMDEIFKEEEKEKIAVEENVDIENVENKTRISSKNSQQKSKRQTKQKSIVDND